MLDPNPSNTAAPRPPKRPRRFPVVPLAFSLIAVALHVAFCAESPLIDRSFRPTIENWILAGAYSLAGIFFSLPTGIAFKLLPRLREKWAAPLAAGLYFGLAIRLASYAIPNYLPSSPTQAQRTGVASQREFVSADASYAVTFPTPPSTITSQVSTDLGPVQSRTTATTFERNEYMLNHMDITDQMMPLGADAYLDAAKLGIVSSLGASAVDESSVSIGGHPGRAFSVSSGISGKNVVLHCRMYLVGRRFVKLIVAGESSTFDQARAESFLESFRLLPAQRIGAESQVQIRVSEPDLQGLVSRPAPFELNEPNDLVDFAARHDAMDAVERDAIAAGAPPGLFGTRWLMSMNEVMSILPDAQRQSPDSLSEFRTFYDRSAIVTYRFVDDVLLMFSVAFLGASSDADFDRTQARLSADYGAMPTPAPSNQYTRVSRREVNHFVIQHCVSEPLGTPIEQVLFYKSE